MVVVFVKFLGDVELGGGKTVGREEFYLPRLARGSGGLPIVDPSTGIPPKYFVIHSSIREGHTCGFRDGLDSSVCYLFLEKVGLICDSQDASLPPPVGLCPYRHVVDYLINSDYRVRAHDHSYNPGQGIDSHKQRMIAF